MLKENIKKVDELLENSIISESLAAAMQGEGDELSKRALDNAGSTPSWEDCVGQELRVEGFDLIRSTARVYKNRRKNQFEELKNNGAEVHTADGLDTDGKPLGEYVENEIAFVAALTSGCRSNISVNTLQSYAKNKKSFKADTKKMSNILSFTAPTAGDYVATCGLVGKTLKVAAAEKIGRFGSNGVLFEIVESAKQAKKK